MFDGYQIPAISSTSVNSVGIVVTSASRLAAAGVIAKRGSADFARIHTTPAPANAPK